MNQEKEYLQFARHQPIEHQEFAQDGYLNVLDFLACEKFNFSHRHLCAMVTESENHRVGVGFLNDVEYFARAETNAPDEAAYKAAAQKVRDLVLKEDESRPSVYENAKRWPRIQSWYKERDVMCKMDARPKVDDLEYYRYLRRQKGLTMAQALQKTSPLFDVEYQKYLEARYPTNKGKQKTVVTVPFWKLKLETYRDALNILISDGKSHPLASCSELVNCLNALRTGFSEELSEKRQQNPNYKVDKAWSDAMNAQFNRIDSILNEVRRCEVFEVEQNRRIGLARDYNK